MAHVEFASSEPKLLPELPDALLLLVLSFLPAKEIPTAVATVWGAECTRRGCGVCWGAECTRHCSAAVTLRLERISEPLLAALGCRRDTLSSDFWDSELLFKTAMYVDRMCERQRASVAAGAAHSVCLRPGDGRAYSWGGQESSSHLLPRNLYTLHHLGLGHEVGACVRAPAKMVGLDGSDLRLMEVAAGREHTLLLTAEGVVHSCGENSWAQLGQGSGHSSFDSRAPCAVLSPVAQLADQYIVQVAAGGNQSLALAATGELWAFGAQRHPTSLNEMRMRRVDAEGNAFVDPSGERIRIVHVSAGESHAVAVGEDGSVFGWGRNQFFQCGLQLLPGPNAQHYTSLDWVGSPQRIRLPARVHIRHVSAGRHHTLFVCAAGALYTCGRGESGRLGHGDTSDRKAPAKVEALAAMRVVRAAAGGDHSVVLADGGALWSFGGGQAGQLGLGRREDHHEPTHVAALAHECVLDAAAGEQFTLVVTESGALFGFGWNAQGQLGLGTGQAASRLPERVDLPPAAAAAIGCWEMRPQWNVHFSFSVAFRRPSSEQAAWPVPEEFEPD